MKIEELEKQQKELLESVKRIGEQIEELKNPKPEFEVGKWYKLKNYHDTIIRFSAVGEKNDGICSGRWITGHGMSNIDFWEPATEEQIKSFLIKEAERRGLKENCFIKSLDYGLRGPCGKNFEYKASEDTLHGNTDGTCILYHKGQWAEFINCEVIEIGGYEVSFVNRDTTQISGYNFSKEFWQAALLVSGHSKAKIKIGCSHQFDLDTETINKILSKL